MQQRLENLSVQNLVDANGPVQELLSLNSRLRLCASSDIQNVTIITYSVVSHSSKRGFYGQSGIISGLNNEANIFIWYHPLIRSSHKQWKVCYSFFGAETLFAIDADDRGLYLKQLLSSLFPLADVKHKLMVGSKFLFETISTFHTTWDYQLRGIVSWMRNSFEDKKLNVVGRIPG